MKGRAYRYFGAEVLYPFGYGLSYTDFSYSKPKLGKAEINKDETLNVKVTITNTGKYDGATVVQLYINDKESSVILYVFKQLWSYVLCCLIFF